jgi:tRNA nucleotidyltransferase (CCA-adding enzyme)
MKIYLVGGAVRDKLLGLPVKERDWVVVGASPEMLISFGFKPIGQDFPVFLHPETKEEYALARTERKVGVGYQGFVFNTSLSVTLEEDLMRRDLTINAIAEDETGQLIDPYHGLDDIRHRLLRHVSPAFSEDPVRVLRIARFVARYHHLKFKIADETLQLMEEMVKAGEVGHLVPERVWQELYKALEEEHPQYFFETLRRCGAQKVIFPEIDALFGVPANPEHHPEIDTGIHTMMVLEAASKLSDSPKIRFAALMHDVGKGLTPQALWPKHTGHEAAGVPLVETFCERLRVPKAFKELAQLVTRYHRDCHTILEATPEATINLLEKLDAYRREARFHEFLLACEADSKGRKGYESSEYPQKAYLLSAYAKTREVDVRRLLAEGYQGEPLKEAIHQARVRQLL